MRIIRCQNCKSWQKLESHYSSDFGYCSIFEWNVYGDMNHTCDNFIVKDNNELKEEQQ